MTSQHPLLLLVDDDHMVLDVVARFARRAGFDVVTCANGRAALDELRRQPADLAMVDLRMPDVNGLDVLRAIREAVPACAVVLMTGYAEIDSAVEAVKLGAIDYLAKPIDFDRLSRVLDTVREEAERRRSLLAAEGEVARRLEFCDMIGRSPVMQETFSLIRRLAPHVRTALITGETGTGKELAARALHRMGPRRDRRFVAVNCSAVVETLFESELFGHVRGAFTGATETKPGLFELADGGTLFLDEIGELPMSMQAKLLRVLETGEVQRVGALETRKVDAHVFASTNRDLRLEVGASRFRSDLFYRLNVVELRLPPLRRRADDIPYLTAAFVRECAGRLGKPLVGLTASAERLLVSAPWEGNVRELRNVVERACILADGDLITEKDLAVSLPVAAEPPTLPLVSFADALTQVQSEAASANRDEESLATIERDHILRTLRRAGGNKKAAAKMLGLSRRALYRRLERHRLDQTIARRKVGEFSAAD
jgi:two-component system, NtrC family, response regulator HydG